MFACLLKLFLPSPKTYNTSTNIWIIIFSGRVYQVKGIYADRTAYCSVQIDKSTFALVNWEKKELYFSNSMDISGQRVETSAGGLLVLQCIIHPVVGALAMAWFMRYIYNWNVQFLNNVIVIKTKVLVHQA